ncbi:choline dehydrogenase [Diaporthe helianthi]|uniref:Choline dehydrogenase n=1 Tax=Diaporthe helianthi TaxID=158607 RepID=A0A2P5HRD9_DIAHE|nr:choline dehydrogenase [Diaporthe helianthi]
MASEYDFVVVGGGTAGLVVAARLSEDPNSKVLVLEAGSDHTEDPRVKIPIFYSALLGSEADWSFRSEPQKSLDGRVIHLHQGKALGGSSTLNAHVFVPPAKGLIDTWERLGNKGWSWNNLKTHLSKAYTSPSVDEATLKSLGIQDWSKRNDEAKGPIQTSFSGDVWHPIREAWAASFKNNGHFMPEDPFLNSSVGAFSCLATIDPVTKERSYSATAYYNPVKGRDNLQVLTNANVEKILTQKDSGFTKATGVQFSHDGTSKTVLARKEVVLAAGVFQSPKLLELSGIGNEELLKEHGIEVVEPLPGVGENLHDHTIVYTGFRASDDVATLDPLIRQEPEALQQAIQEYGATQSGPLSSCGVYSYAYMPVLEHASDEGQKALKTLLDQNRPASGSSPEEVRAKAFYDVLETTLLDQEQPSGAYVSALAQITIPIDANAEKPPAALPGKFISIGSMLSQPLSRGSVHIRSKDPSAQPVIDPNYLSHPIDVEIMAHHVLQTKKIAALSPLDNLLAKPLTHRDPAAEFTDLESAKAYVRGNAISMWHLGGTCAMLPREKAGVVDTNLKVYGVDNLRVVDSSAIPLISTANLQAAVYAFAEKAADIIRNYWSSK